MPYKGRDPRRRCKGCRTRLDAPGSWCAVCSRAADTVSAGTRAEKLLMTRMPGRAAAVQEYTRRAGSRLPLFD